jgi:hypothetical protein
VVVVVVVVSVAVAVVVSVVVVVCVCVGGGGVLRCALLARRPPPSVLPAPRTKQLTANTPQPLTSRRVRGCDGDEPKHLELLELHADLGV